MKTDFTKYLTTDSIITLKGTSKREVISELVVLASEKSGMDRDQLEEAVWKREKMMTTGVGKGLALPHIRIPSFGDPLVIVGVCSVPLEDYETLDDVPVSVIIFLIAPEGSQEQYLQLLGSISSKLKTDGIIDEIVACNGKRTKLLRLLKKKS